MFSLEGLAGICELLCCLSNVLSSSNGADVAEMLEVLAAVVGGNTAGVFKGVNQEAVAVIVLEVGSEVGFLHTWEDLIEDRVIVVSGVDLGNELGVGLVTTLSDDSVVKVVEEVVSLIDMLSGLGLLVGEHAWHAAEHSLGPEGSRGFVVCSLELTDGLTHEGEVSELEDWGFVGLGLDSVELLGEGLSAHLSCGNSSVSVFHPVGGEKIS